MKIINGGIYLVKFTDTINPELKDPHYCVVLKTHDKDLFVALPTTSKKKKDLYSFLIPEDSSTCLFKHMKVVARGRIIKPLEDSNKNPIVLSNENLTKLLAKFRIFIDDICRNAILSNKYASQRQNV